MKRKSPVCAIPADKTNTAPSSSAVVDSSHPYRVSRFRMFDNP